MTFWQKQLYTWNNSIIRKRFFTLNNLYSNDGTEENLNDLQIQTKETYRSNVYKNHREELNSLTASKNTELT